MTLLLFALVDKNLKSLLSVFNTHGTTDLHDILLFGNLAIFKLLVLDYNQLPKKVAEEDDDRQLTLKHGLSSF